MGFSSSIDWFKGKITGKSHISWENLWFPVGFPLSQPGDVSVYHGVSSSGLDDRQRAGLGTAGARAKDGTKSFDPHVPRRAEIDVEVGECVGSMGLRIGNFTVV